MIFYTADLHFSSAATIEQAQRPFASPAEMDARLIANWNARVSAEDTVYVLGDLGEHGAPIPTEQLSRLQGHKHLIRGNHDTGLEQQERLFDFFETVADFWELDDGDTHILLCHYPILYRQRGLMIHGHIHRTQPELFEILKGLDRVMNACVDINHYAPVTLPELIENNRIYYGRPAAQERPRGKNPKRWPAVFKPLPQRKEYDL